MRSGWHNIDLIKTFTYFNKTLLILILNLIHFFPQPGWVEHDPEEMWASQAGVIAEAVAKLKHNEHVIATIGITNQRETTIVWERKTGRPIYNAIYGEMKSTK